MAFQIIRKDFLPIAKYDGSEYREYAMRYSYTGREFDSIDGYLISNGIDQFWATEEDIIELFPNIVIDDIPDDTESNLTEQVINIFDALINLGEGVDIATQRVKNYMRHPIIKNYVLSINHQ